MEVEQGSGRRVQAWKVRLNKDRAKGSGFLARSHFRVDLQRALLRKQQN